MFRWSLVIAFAIALGHLSWLAFARAPIQEYWVEGDGSVLRGPDADQKQLYLRRELYLSQQPRRAWVQVLGRDRLKVYVNGQFVASESLLGGSVAVVADLAPYLIKGRNVIAVAASQQTFGVPPAVAIRGAYAFEQEEYRIAADDQWRCQSVFERKAQWWFEPDFSDRHWPSAVVCQGQLSARVPDPPRATTEPNVGKWITPVGVDQGHAAVRREFDLDERPRQAWLRVTASSSYRLVVNGVPIDQQEDQVAAMVPVPPIQRIYDLSPVIRAGHNVIALALTATAGELPRLLADIEVAGATGKFYRFGTDGDWLSLPGLPRDWLAATVASGQWPVARENAGDSLLATGHSPLTTIWRPSHVEKGDLRTPSWQPSRQTVALVLPWAFTFTRIVEQIAWMAAIALIAWLACLLAERLLSRLLGASRETASVCLAFLPATLAIAAAVLATWDPRVASRDVYRGLWVFLAVASVIVQWGLLALLASFRQAAWRFARNGKLLASPVVLLSILLIAGGWLRLRNIATEGLMWDEVENNHATLGFLERGFPSVKVHDDLPPMYIHTSELQFIPMAAVALLTDNAAWVVRFPAVIWSLLTILLIYQVGRKMFTPSVGLLAAAVYTMAPLCIAMSNFGRYFSQLQFFALLTVYFFWLTVRGTGAIDRRALWLTAVCFIAMFLTWEASALLALGMIPAALLYRYGRLGTIFRTSAVWAALFVVLLAVVVQQSHMMLQHTQFLWYGVSLSDTRLIPVWRFPAPAVFRPWFYIWQSCWNRDALLPLLGLLGAMVLAVRHGWRDPVRFLLIVFLGGCLSMSFLLPNPQWRFTQHLIPLALLLSSAALTAGLHQLVELARQGRDKETRRQGDKETRADDAAALLVSLSPCLLVRYARGLSTVAALGIALIASGSVLDLREMTRFRIEGHSTTGYQFPNLAAGAQYLRKHMQPGDVLMANNVYQIHHGMGIDTRPNRSLDFTPATSSFLPATLDDNRSVLLDRRDGCQMLSTPESIKDLFARHGRIWYVVKPGQHANFNTPEVSAFLRQHMEVVFEDWDTVVLFGGGSHRPASLRMDNERVLGQAQAQGAFLP